MHNNTFHSFFNLRSLILLGLGLLFVNSAVVAQSLETFTLKDAQEYALTNNLNMKIKQTDIAIAKEQVNETKAIGLPNVSGGLNYQHFVQLPVSLVPAIFFNPMAAEGEFAELTFGTKNNLTAKLEASQLLFNGSYLVALEGSKTFVNLSEQNLQQAQIDLKYSVTQSYYNALIAQEQVRLLEMNTANLSKILFETEELNKSGFVEEMDVDRLRLTLNNLKTQIFSAQRGAELALNALKFQMGMDASTPIELSESLQDIVANLETMAVDESFNPESRAEYRLLDQQEKLNELDIKNYRWQRLPNLAAFASYQQTFQNDNFDVFDGDFWFPTFVVGLQLNVPIFQGLGKNAQIAQRELMTVQLRDGKDLLKESFNLEITQAKMNFTSALEQVKSQEENIKLAQKIYDTAIIKYNEGLGSSLEVNSAESSLFETQGLYVQSLLSLVLAKTNLDKALGTL